MASNNTRARMLMIMELLYTKSDEDNPVTTVDITEYLESKGIPVNRKTLHDDMQAIMAMGYDIVMQKSSPNKYFWGDRTFEIPELKLLIDAVSSSRFITEKKSQGLIRKISSLASESQAKLLKRHIAATGHTKADNTKIYYIVDTITDAINQKKKIEFKYFEYNVKKEKVFKHNGEVYILSPYYLYWNEDYYYVVGYSDKHNKISAFRVDRLYKPNMINELAEPKARDFEVRDYADKIFSMFDGKEEIVTLECENSLMKYIIDRFGIDVDIEEKNKDTFIARVPVTLSPTFYGWVFQFAGGIKIIGPDMAVDEYNKMKLV